MGRVIDYVHAPDQHRYEIRDDEADGGLAGFAEYRLPDDVHVDFVHTEVEKWGRTVQQSGAKIE